MPDPRPCGLGPCAIMRAALEANRRVLMGGGANTSIKRCEEAAMLRMGRVAVFACGALLVCGAHSFAQTLPTSIAGTVKDASGAVMPGVTIEAASNALIEKVRTVISDARGEYKIVDLRSGTYT